MENIEEFYDNDPLNLISSDELCPECGESFQVEEDYNDVVNSYVECTECDHDFICDNEDITGFDASIMMFSTYDIWVDNDKNMTKSIKSQALKLQQKDINSTPSIFMIRKSGVTEVSDFDDEGEEFY